MKKTLLSLVMAFSILVAPPLSQAAMPVIDVASIAQLIEQIHHMMTMIDQLKDLNNWAEIDHTNLAGKKFKQFFSKYRKMFDDIMKEIEGYQDGGLLGQIERLDEVYFPYHEGWEDEDREDDFTTKADPKIRAIKKQILWTRIQLKHAAKVAAKVRDTIPQQEEQIQVLLDDTAQAVGLMQSVKIGNQISGMMAKSLQTLNLQLTEIIQERAASGLEQNHKDGLQKNRQREAIKDFGVRQSPVQTNPLNPVGAF